jgi:hypothetical protein
LRRHIFVPQHFWQYVALHFGFGPPGTEISVGQFLWDLLATQVWLAVPPMQLRGKAMAVVGAPGAGKTVTLLRLAYLAARAGRKVCFADCKGTDPTLVPGLIAAYRLGNPAARIGCWPEQAMDMWRGTQAQVQSRLLAIEQFTEPLYQRVASAGLRLALTAPDMPPVEGSDELLRRLDVDELAALWEGRPLQLKDIEAIATTCPAPACAMPTSLPPWPPPSPGPLGSGRWSWPGRWGIGG